MVSQSIKACPQLLSEEMLQQFVVAEMGEDFLEAKKVVGHKMAPEIISRISSINLEMAAHISELITDRILEKLERSNRRLVGGAALVYQYHIWKLTVWYVTLSSSCRRHP